MLDGAVEAARLVGQRPGAGLEAASTAPIAAIAAGDHERRSRPPRRAAPSRAPSTRPGPRPRRGARSRRRCSRRRRGAPPSCSSSRRAAKSCASIGGALAGPVPRDVDPLPARGRPAGRCRARAAAAQACAEAVGLPMAAAWPTSRRGASTLDAGDAARAPPSARWRRRPARRGRRRRRGGARADARRPRARAGGRPERAAAELERAAVDFDACGAPRYRDEAERSCASSAAASTGARGREADESASRR